MHGSIIKNCRTKVEKRREKKEKKQESMNKKTKINVIRNKSVIFS